MPLKLLNSLIAEWEEDDEMKNGFENFQAIFHFFDKTYKKCYNIIVNKI